MLKTILRNLVGNAIRHAGPRGHVSLSCMRRGGTLQIDVQDDGNGIAVGQLSRIFDAFEALRRRKLSRLTWSRPDHSTPDSRNVAPPDFGAFRRE